MGGNKRYSQLETMVVKVIMKWQWLDVLKRDYPINFLTDGLSGINYELFVITYLTDIPWRRCTKYT
jgi:hypothetical protein